MHCQLVGGSYRKHNYAFIIVAAVSGAAFIGLLRIRHLADNIPNVFSIVLRQRPSW